MNQYCLKNYMCNANSEQASFMIISLKDMVKSEAMLLKDIACYLNIIA